MIWVSWLETAPFVFYITSSCVGCVSCEQYGSKWRLVSILRTVLRRIHHSDLLSRTTAMHDVTHSLQIFFLCFLLEVFRTM